MIAAGLLLAVAPAGIFAPPLDRPLTVTVSETRTIGGRIQHFRIVRRVTFSLRAGGGYAATVETEAVDGSPGGAEALFLAAMRPGVGTRITVLLDAAGRIVDVADREALWARQVAAIGAGVVRGRPDRAATAEVLLAPLRTADAATQIRLLGGAVAAIVDPELAGRTPAAPRPLTQSARGPAGPITLSGTEHVVREAADAVRLERKAAGDGQNVATVRIVDTRSGLVRRAQETRTITLDGSSTTIARETVVS